ncbi:MAG: DUF3592 domain-containing protein [Methylococcales bacterium]
MESGQLQDKKIFEFKKMYTYIILILAVSFALAATWKFVDSRNWQEVDGYIKHISVEEIYNRPLSSASSNKRFIEYKINLQYEYTHNGKAYTGSQLYPLIPNIFQSKKYTDEILNKFKENQSSSVFINPSNPASSCLITSKNISTVRIFIFAFILLSIISLAIAAYLYVSKNIFS